MEPLTVGCWLRSDSRFGALFHAELYPGRENSGKLVTAIRRESAAWGVAEDAALLIVDGPPGIGCPALAAATGCDLVLFVAEPTVSGLQDVERAMDTIQPLEAPGLLCINKWDVNPELADALQAAGRRRHIDTVARIPLDPIVVRATNARRPVTDYGADRVLGPIRDAWREVEHRLGLVSDRGLARGHVLRRYSS
jgi:MinD superfamily P-loop ATPase